MKVKNTAIGDLVKVKGCSAVSTCNCFFCSGNSNRCGYVLGPAQRNNWYVGFDIGEKVLHNNDFIFTSSTT